jgi:fatty acid desaturase
MPGAEQIPETTRADQPRDRSSRWLCRRNLWGFAALAGFFMAAAAPARAQMTSLWILLVIIGGAFFADCLWRMSRVTRDRKARGD